MKSKDEEELETRRHFVSFGHEVAKSLSVPCPRTSIVFHVIVFAFSADICWKLSIFCLLE